MDVWYRVETADHHIINDFDQTVDFDGDLPFPDDDDTAVTKGGTSTYVEVLAVPADDHRRRWPASTCTSR